MAAEAELENIVLRHEVAILRRQVKGPVYRASDRAFLAARSRMLQREAWSAFQVAPLGKAKVAQEEQSVRNSGRGGESMLTSTPAVWRRLF
jgi:hypothetical protein